MRIFMCMFLSHSHSVSPYPHPRHPSGDPSQRQDRPRKRLDGTTADFAAGIAGQVLGAHGFVTLEEHPGCSCHVAFFMGKPQ